MDHPTGPDPMAAEKMALRRLARDRRARFVAGLPASVRGIAFRVLPAPVVRRLIPGAVVALYHAIGDEVPTDRIADQLSDLGYRLALPRIRGVDAVMDLGAWHPEEILVPGPYRCLQPGERAAALAPDAIIAPLLAFDAGLNRLGQGGGHYDRLFARYPDALRIGLAWSVQQIDRVPVEPFDLPLDLVVTEAALLERNGSS